MITSQYNTFAAPGAPSTSPIITVSSDPSVDFNFTQTELTSSTFKHGSFLIDVYTNNSTGATAYISSIDEDTNLNHSDPSVLQKIPSITTPLADTAFSSKTWGYRAAAILPTGNYHPVPKASTPDTLFTKKSAFGTKHFIDFGVKSGPDLPAGTYSKQIVFTVISNYVPTTATFIEGPDFNDVVRDITPTKYINVFKHSSVAPANPTLARIVSTPDSDRPIYLWYDTINKTLLWWSDADVSYANINAGFMFHDLNGGANDVSVIDTTGIDTSKAKDMRFMFHSGEKLVKDLIIGNLNTSQVENMRYMFGSDDSNTGTVSPSPIDLSHFDTSNVRDMEGMFQGSHLPNIDVRHFDVGRVTNLSFTFARLKNVTSLDLSGWNTRNVTNMNSTFVYSEEITDLNVSGWQNDSATDMAAMFGRLTNLRNFQYAGFTTKNVQNMEFMFSHWSAVPVLQNLDLSNFDTSNVVTMESMFQGQTNLINLNISSFDTRKVTNMKDMFLSSMKNPGNGTLDISSFDTRSLTEAEAMFSGSGVKTILVSPSFTVAGLSSAPQKMFEHTSNVVGGNGTSYVWPNYNSDYAHIDAPGNPGYFTQR